MPQRPARSTTARVLPAPRRAPGRAVLTVLLVAATAFLLVTNPTVGNAAKMITGQQIKNSSITGQDIKDRSITVKDLSTSSVKALHGADGRNGTDGTNGRDGASAFAPPPAGTVIRGGDLLDAQTSAATKLREYTPLPFTTRLPIVDYNTMATGPRSIFFGESDIAEAVDTNTTSCPGTFAVPTAAPGILCVYIDDARSTNVQSASAILLAGADSDSDGADGAARSGFYLSANSSGAGDLLVRYSWAYTAD